MSNSQKDARAARRARCKTAGDVKLSKLRDGVATSQEVSESRAALLSGDCPLCGESGFKNIAGHCQQMHGVLSREIRDLLNLTYTESICSPSLHQTFSDLSVGRNPRAIKPPSYASREYSKKGLEVRNNNLAPPLTWVTKDVLRENGRLVGLARKGKAPWNKSSEHGSRAMFRQGCRCGLCDEANKEYWKKVNKNRAKSVAGDA